MNDVVYLVTETYKFDEIGQQIPTRAEQMIFCELCSISQSEFFEAARTGLKPQYKIKAWKNDYHNEQTIKIGSEYYSVYRTYAVYDFIELYVEKRGGNNVD